MSDRATSDRAAVERRLNALIGEYNGALIDKANRWFELGMISEETRAAFTALVLISDEVPPPGVFQRMQHLHGMPVETTDEIVARVGDGRDNRVSRAAADIAAVTPSPAVTVIAEVLDQHWRMCGTEKAHWILDPYSRRREYPELEAALKAGI